MRFEKKPSPELVERYRIILEDLLSHLQAKVSVEILDPPMITGRVGNRGELIHETCHWISGVRVTTPEVADILVEVSRDGLDEEITRQSVWDDAFEIQEAIYRSLGRNPGRPQEGDPYWELWNKRT